MPKSTHSTENDTVVGGTVFMVFALNCGPCSLFLTHQPPATSHSPAVTEGSDPMTVVSSRWTLCLQAQRTGHRTQDTDRSLGCER